MAGMSMIIVLAFFLALGILSIILSCALFNNWLPLINVLTYLLAPIPNSICKRLSGTSDFFTQETNGFGFPLTLYHTDLITFPAMILSLAGGLLIYGTVIGYKHFFIVNEPSY